MKPIVYPADSKDISAATHTLAAGRSYEIHRHDYYEMELILRGRAAGVQNGRRYLLKRGSCYLLRPCDDHSFVAETDVLLLNITFSPKRLRHDLYNRMATPSALFAELSEPDLHTFRALFRCLREVPEGRADEVREDLLSCLLRLFLNAARPPSASAGIQPPIRRALLYLQQHFSESPSLTETAAVAHYHPGHFSTAFQEQTGLSFCTYLNRLKVNYAKSLLVRTDEKIGSVAAASGFTSQVNFLKVFKKETGLTPTQYRSREKAD